MCSNGNPATCFDTMTSYTAAELLARDAVRQIDTVDAVVEGMRELYSALFDAKEQLSDIVSWKEHEALEKERDAALDKIEALEGERDAALARIAALEKERDAALAKIEARRST